MTYLTAIGTAHPSHQFLQSDVAQYMQRKLPLDARARRVLAAVYRASGIHTRYSVLPDFGTAATGGFFAEAHAPSTAQRLAIYQQHAPQLAQAAVRNALGHQAELLPAITHLITFSCTGMYAPGLDIDLVNHLKLSPQVARTGINFMGCYAAFTALKVGDAICRSDPRAKVLLVGVELCTLHFQYTATEDDILAGALFGDGAAAVLLEGQPRSQQAGFKLRGFHCDLAPQGSQEMTWAIKDFGFAMRLSSYVPEMLADKLSPLITQLRQAIDIAPEAPWLYALHPGGRRILDTAERVLEISPTQNIAAHSVLREAGNMSSVTVLFVLKELLRRVGAADAGRPVLSMAFGPGLTLEAAILEIYRP